MKNTLALAALTLLATPAFADIDTICQGGGPKGNSEKIELKVTSGRWGQPVDQFVVNGVKTDGIFRGQVGDVVMIDFDGAGIALTLKYNFEDNSAVLVSPEGSPELFCSRGIE